MGKTIVCKESDVSPGQMIKVTVSGKDLLIANLDGEFYGLDDTCTHAGASLSDGQLDGSTVKCGWHGAEFDCKTGKLTKFPAKINDISSHVVSVESGNIFLET